MNRTGYHNHINSQEVTELIRELALVCEDTSIVSILNRLGYRTGNGNTWTEKRVATCPPYKRLSRLSVTRSAGVDHPATGRCYAPCQ
jgi:hypothetical protein